MKQICPEFYVSREDFTGENRETYWKNIFNFKRLKISKQKVFTGMFDIDGVSTCIHYRRLKVDRPNASLLSPLAEHEEKKEADPGTYNP